MDPSDAPSTVTRRRLLGVNGWLAIVLLVPFIWAATMRGDAFPLYLFQTQDMPVIGGLIALLLLTDRWSPRWRLPFARPTVWHVLAGGIAMALLLWGGCYALLGNYPLSRDEHMVVFDMGVFAHGHLAEPMAAQWRPFAVDLVPAFLLQENMPAGLVSDYLPGNSALRLLFSFVADPALMNPLLVLCGGLALLDIARRLFGDDPRAIWVALLTYALSAQVAVNAMLPYAMTAHMALNLLWLAAFLRGRWWHVAAILFGLIATGLHQIVFHPLFVAPFLLWRLREGHWRLVLAYSAAYAAICGWWITYPMLASMQAGAGTLGGAPHSFFADRVLPLLLDRDPMTLPLMTLNLLRFVAWQNLALLPLVAFAAPLALNTRSIVAPMFWGALGATLFFGFILPYQGHGWGYRYLHPYLGSIVLLAAFGYRRLAAMKGRAADAMVVLLSAATLFGSMPYLIDRTRAFFSPHRALEQFIAHQQGDFVLVDTERMVQTTDGSWAREAVDQVRNLPDLSNRPLRFSSRAMSQARLAELCRRGTVTPITRADMRRIGFASNAAPAPRFDAMIETTRRARPHCFRGAD
ncbi:MAG: hypothetical protein J7485_02440 [Sphingobium sp.]|nr:hypothetical protein [Sphingobium sp.]